MGEYFPKSEICRFELDLSNYATKADFKSATVVNTSRFAKNVDLAKLKSEVGKLGSDKLEKVPTGLNSLESKVNKLNVDKLATVPGGFSKLSDAVTTMLLKRLNMMNWLKKLTLLKLPILVILSKN